MLKYLSIVASDLAEHFSKNWPFYATVTWLGGGSLLLHIFKRELYAMGFGTSSGAEPIAMLIISALLAIVGFIGYHIWSYFKSVKDRAHGK